MLPLVQFALNNCSIWDLTVTPFLALHGYEPMPLPELILREEVPKADKFLSNLQEIWDKYSRMPRVRTRTFMINLCESLITTRQETWSI